MKVSETGFGVDVTLRRADDLDKKLLAELKGCVSCRVLDLGCGAGGAAARLAALGAHVIGIDQHDFADEFQRNVGERGVFIKTDIRNFSSVVGDTAFEYVLLQRTLHYVRYFEAVQVLENLKRHTKQKLFLSLSGLHSDLGKVYTATELLVDERFGPLTNEGQKTFGIQASLTLYTKEEAVILAERSGWQVEEVWQSAFGNIKMILEK